MYLRKRMGEHKLHVPKMYSIWTRIQEGTSGKGKTKHVLATVDNLTLQ